MSGSAEPKKISETAEKKLREIMARYPSSDSAILPALYIAQEEFGWLTKEAMLWVADRLSLTPAMVLEVASFYTMLHKKPAGRYHIQVCRTISCHLTGARSLVECIKKRLGVNPHEVTSDGMWSYEEVECLGSCGTGPMVQINDIFFERLTAEKLNALLDRIARELPDLRYSTIREELGAGLEGSPKSQIMSKEAPAGSEVAKDQA